MGGKALKQYGVYTNRKDTETFLAIGKKLQNSLLSDLGLESAVVKCYSTKSDHGDLDLLIKTKSETNIDYINYIKSTFNPKAIHSGGGVHSFDLDDFQIDFILINEGNWEIANTYYSYDPLGNIMGKVYHKFGLSYGWKGLFYKFRNFDGRLTQNILISCNPKKIFEFGGYDYDRYLKGFDNIDDIFQFSRDGKYFDANIFQYVNLNHIDKKRNIKRKSYNIYLEYLNNEDIISKTSFNVNKAEYIPIINEFFPEANLIQILDRLNIQDKINKTISEKFNGNLVKEWIECIDGKELGNSIIKFKTALGEKYNDYIFNTDSDKIKLYFLEIYGK